MRISLVALLAVACNTNTPKATEAEKRADNKAEKKAAPSGAEAKAKAKAAPAGEKDKAKKEKAAKPAAAAVEAPKGDPKCEAYAATFCKEVGEDKEACKTLRDAAKLLPASACTAAQSDLALTVKRAKAMKGTCEALVEKLCGEIGNDTETCKMVKEKTPSFPKTRCQEMMKNYGKVLGELKELEARNQPLTAEMQAKHLAGNPPSFGKADAVVKIVEFSDFECPYCSTAAKSVGKLKKRYSDNVLIIFRNFPLSFHKKAMPAAQAAIEAHVQGKFWPFHDLMFENQRKLDRPNLETYAEQLGLDMGKFKAALDNKTHEASVKADLELGKASGVRGTPTVFINGKRARNAADFKSLTETIDKALAAAGKPVPKAE